VNDGNETESPIKGAVFRLTDVVARFERLLTLSAGFKGERLQGAILADFAKIVCRGLRLYDEARERAHAALTLYSGRVLDWAFYIDLCWLMAAGYPRFKKGLEIRNKFSDAGSRWVGIQVTDVRPAPRSKHGTNRAEVHFRILTGIFCGLKFTQWMPHDYVTKIMAKTMGTLRYAGAQPKEVVGMLGVVLIELNRRGPQVRDLRVPGGALTYNKKLRNKRAEPCIWKYQWPCHLCPIGNSAESQRCSRGTHPFTYEYRECPSCKHRTWFDTHSKSGVCVSCGEKRSKR